MSVLNSLPLFIDETVANTAKARQQPMVKTYIIYTTINHECDFEFAEATTMRAAIEKFEEQFPGRSWTKCSAQDNGAPEEVLTREDYVRITTDEKQWGEPGRAQMVKDMESQCVKKSNA